MVEHTSYLDRLDAADEREKVRLASEWLGNDWRPFFAELRTRRPILRTAAFTLVTRFADVTEVLSRERVFTVHPYQSRMDPVVGPFMLARDAMPENWREKGIMQAVLRPEDLPAVRNLAGAIADEALDAASPEGRIEVVSRLGRYVPIRVCGEYFGFPGPDVQTMFRWSRATQVDMFNNLQDDPDVHQASVRAGREMRKYLQELLREKQDACGDDRDGSEDVFARLVKTRFPKEIGFDDERIMSNVAGLLIGAGETTSRAIVQILEQLLERAEIRERAAEAASGSEEYYDPYVWEALRFNPINRLVVRRCERDYTVAAGTEREATIPARTLVFACTASAMFDEEIVPDPESFRTDRPDYSMLHFGYGHHACLGRHVGAVMIPEVVRRVLLRPRVNLLPPPDGSIDFQSGPFPERFVLALDDRSRPPGGGVRPSSGRSRARDGWANKAEEFLLTTRAGPAWDLIHRLPPIRRRVNKALINLSISKMPHRPNPLSTLAPYTSWRSLTDRSYDSRHLPPLPDADTSLPDEAEIARRLFLRDPKGDTVPCQKSTVLFAYFAQWFTDGFLRSDRGQRRDPRKNSSNHDIDLSQLYGLTPATTRLLRSWEGGRLKSQMIRGEEYPPYLCREGQITDEFEGLTVIGFEGLTTEQRDELLAMGSDSSNSQLGFGMLNVLFLREHNRLATLLALEHPRWDDAQLFATARNVLTVMLIKIVVEEYINHMTPYLFRFFVDPTMLGNEAWYRPNWMAIEFNLLYRWHSLIPSTLRVGGDDLSIDETRWTSTLLTHGLGRLFEDASSQPAGRVGLFNTDQALLETERQSVRQARAVQLAPYNDYRELCKFPRVTAFDQISSDGTVRERLREVYGRVDRVEFYPGLFAEDAPQNSVLPPLIGRMVGVDAFSQALTNPLLAPRVYNESTFSPLGIALLRRHQTLAEVVRRNTPRGSGNGFVSMTRRDWKWVRPRAAEGL